MSKNLTTKDFKELVSELDTENFKFKGDIPAIIDFHAEWCGPCKTLGPILDEVSNEFEGKVNVYKVDVDSETDLSTRFNIRSIPSVMFIPVEGPAKMTTGVLPKQKIVEIINKELKVN